MHWFSLAGDGKQNRGIRQRLRWLMHMPCGMCDGTFDSHPIVAKKSCRAKGTTAFLERMMGVEPTLSAWEAGVLPMNYIRV